MDIQHESMPIIPLEPNTPQPNQKIITFKYILFSIFLIIFSSVLSSTINNFKTGGSYMVLTWFVLLVLSCVISLWLTYLYGINLIQKNEYYKIYFTLTYLIFIASIFSILYFLYHLVIGYFCLASDVKRSCDNFSAIGILPKMSPIFLISLIISYAFSILTIKEEKKYLKTLLTIFFVLFLVMAISFFTIS